ncbi:hypothetical protein NXS19_004563 [Fusarium pseudograminearum]|nr:hypothetical protein NXS19_004563 [Fusarium pseudograminearum]
MLFSYWSLAATRLGLCFGACVCCGSVYKTERSLDLGFLRNTICALVVVVIHCKNLFVAQPLLFLTDTVIECGSEFPRRVTPRTDTDTDTDTDDEATQAEVQIVLTFHRDGLLYELTEGGSHPRRRIRA